MRWVQTPGQNVYFQLTLFCVNFWIYIFSSGHLAGSLSSLKLIKPICNVTQCNLNNMEPNKRDKHHGNRWEVWKDQMLVWCSHSTRRHLEYQQVSHSLQWAKRFRCYQYEIIYFNCTQFPSSRWSTRGRDRQKGLLLCYIIKGWFFFYFDHFSLIIFYPSVKVGFQQFGIRVQVSSQLVRKGYDNHYKPQTGNEAGVWMTSSPEVIGWEFGRFWKKI